MIHTDGRATIVSATCRQCGSPLNPAERMIHAVCGRCVRKNHRGVIQQ
jgi:NMD protein affecting ribosome stability and mRNA decay